MNYNETRDLIRSLTEKLASISRTLSDVCIMFQTDSEGNPTIEAKDQLFFEQRKFLAKQVLPRDLKSLSLELIDSIPAIRDYLENWCNKQADPDIDSLSLALSNLIDNKSAKIGELVPGYYDFISDCDRSKSLIEKGQAKSQQRSQAPKYPCDDFFKRLRSSEAFKQAKDEGKIDDRDNILVWKDSKRSLIDFLIINNLVRCSDSGQYQWKELDGVFSWIVDRGESKGKIKQLSKEELRATLSDQSNNT